MTIGLRLFEMGYRNLVPVIPPDAEISENSSIPPHMRGKAPGRRNAAGKWSGFPQWQQFRPTAEQVAKFEAQGANIGMNASGFPALDIDSLDKEVADRVQSFAVITLGLAPVRYGRAPKRLLVYRSDADFPEHRLVLEKDGVHHLIEVLSGPKRQYLVAGTHPSGSPYRWDGTPLWEWDQRDLATISEQMVLSFFDDIATHFTAQGFTVVKRTGARGSAPPPPQDDLLAPSLTALTECVRAIPNDDETSPDREHYLSMAYAIKAAAGPENEFEGRDIFFEWAGKREPDDRVAGNPETWEADWKRCHPPYRIGWDWLKEQTPNAAQHEFEATEEAEPQAALALDPKMDETDVLDLIVEDLRGALKYGSDGAWYQWDGGRWAKTANEVALGIVMEACRRLARALRQRASISPTKAEAAPFVKLAARITGLKFLPTVQSTLRATLYIDVTKFDADPWMLNTPDGIVDLRVGVLRETTPDDLCSRVTAASPIADPPEIWLKFLAEVTNHDVEMQRYLQKFLGYCLTGLTHEQKLLFVWGPGGNGKSVLVNTALYIMGEYGMTAPMDTFATSHGDSHPTAIAGLVGARLVSATETQAGQRWDEARVKSLTGGEPVRTRFLYRDFFTFTPQFTLVLVGNHAPEIRALDDAMRRRLNIVPFVFTPERVDLFLGDKLKGEAGEILQWLIDGCLMWQREGLQPPERVIAQTQEYFEEEDPLQQWMDEECVLGAADERGEFKVRATSSALYRSWSQWCNRVGEHGGSQKQFARRLGAKLGRKSVTFRIEDGSVHRGYLGIDLKAVSLEGII